MATGPAATPPRARRHVARYMNRGRRSTRGIIPMSTETRLDPLLERWEEERGRGVSRPVEDLCGDCPELIEALRARIAVMERMDGCLASTPDVDGDSLPPTAPRLAPAVAEYRGLSF